MLTNEFITKMANDLVERNMTIRETAYTYGISKSYCHFCLNKVRELDGSLYQEVRRVLECNFNIKHIRGGNATKAKYETIRNKSR